MRSLRGSAQDPDDSDDEYYDQFEPIQKTFSNPRNQIVIFLKDAEAFQGRLGERKIFPNVPVEIQSISSKVELFDSVKSIITPIISSIEADKLIELLCEDYTIVDEKIQQIISTNPYCKMDF